LSLDDHVDRNIPILSLLYPGDKITIVRDVKLNKGNFRDFIDLIHGEDGKVAIVKTNRVQV